MDLSRDQSLLAAGFEDDSFVLYSTNFGMAKGLFTPLCRGLGHKSFVCQIKFDNYSMDYFDRLKNQEKPESPEIDPEAEPSGDMPTSRK